MSATEPRAKSKRTQRVEPPKREVESASRQDYMAIMRNLELYWEADDDRRLERIRILHHPMFFEELGSSALVLRRDGVVAAYILGFYSQHEVPVAYVHMVATHKNFRRRGLASQLYQYFIETAVLHGCESVCAITSPTNLESIAFHESIGMMPEGVSSSESDIPCLRDYAGPGEDRVKMKKMLSPVLCF